MKRSRGSVRSTLLVYPAGWKLFEFSGAFTFNGESPSSDPELCTCAGGLGLAANEAYHFVTNPGRYNRLCQEEYLGLGGLDLLSQPPPSLAALDKLKECGELLWHLKDEYGSIVADVDACEAAAAADAAAAAAGQPVPFGNRDLARARALIRADAYAKLIQLLELQRCIPELDGLWPPAVGARLGAEIQPLMSGVQGIITTFRN